MAAMDKEALIKEVNRLLDAGEPLLTKFPKYYQNEWPLELPYNISPDMRWYADSVAWRAQDRKGYLDFRQHDTTTYLARLVEDLEAGLLGWRAIGVLQ